MTSEIVTAMDVELISGEQGKHRRSKIKTAEARVILYKGIHQFYKFEKFANVTSRRYFEDVISIEPDSVLGYAWVANAWAFALIVGFENPATAVKALSENVDKCLAIDSNDPLVLVNESYLRAVTSDLDRGLEAAKKAVEVSPNFDDAWFALGWLQMLCGDSPGAIRSLNCAVELCPILGTLQLGVLGTAYRNVGFYDDAIVTFRSCATRFPDFVHAHAGLCVSTAKRRDARNLRNQLTPLRLLSKQTRILSHRPVTQWRGSSRKVCLSEPGCPCARPATKTDVVLPT